MKKTEETEERGERIMHTKNKIISREKSNSSTIQDIKENENGEAILGFGKGLFIRKSFLDTREIKV